MELAGQTLLVIGGSSGIGLETARRAREDGAEVIVTARNADRIHRAGLELGASIAAFDATNFDRLERFFDELPGPIDHVLVTGRGGVKARRGPPACHPSPSIAGSRQRAITEFLERPVALPSGTSTGGRFQKYS